MIIHANVNCVSVPIPCPHALSFTQKDIRDHRNE
jgi:hypothetical protein